MPGADFEPFDVVVVPFPFTDRPASRRRPALIVSTASFNTVHDQLILAMITAARLSDWPSDVRLGGWRAAGLSVACRVRLKLFTLDKSLLAGRLGSLDDDDRTAVRLALADGLAVA
jgi:mRNA interferase MazF